MALNKIEFRSSYIDPAKSPVEYHHAVLAYWDTIRGDRPFPAWRDIDLMALPPETLPLINVADIDPETGEQRYRYWGSGLTKVHGCDFTGRSPAEVPPQVFGSSAQNGYQKLISERRPNLEVKEFITPKAFLGRQLVLRMPLGEDGVVSGGLTVCYYEMATPNAPLNDFFETILKPLASYAS
jgi:hypothetical protein